MKKFVIFTLIIAMAAGAAFAQTANGISVNAWGRGVFAPLVNVGAEQVGGETKKDDAGDAVEGTNHAGTGVTWGGSQIRTDFRINGNADFVGFQFQWTEGGLDGQAHIWAKPFSNDILKLTVGRFEVDNLRGKINTDTGFEDFAVPAKMDEDAIFWRFKSSNAFLLSSQPIDALFIGLKVDADLFKDWGGPSSGTKLMDAYRFLQIGGGYDIDGIGHFRAQFFGGWFGTIDMKTVGEDMGKGKYSIGPFSESIPDWFLDCCGNPPGWFSGTPDDYPIDTTWNPAKIEAAFALTAVDNLLVDLGLKFWLPIELKEFVKVSNGIDVNVGARFRADAFQIIGQIGANFGAYFREYDGKEFSKQANGIGLNVNLIPSYDLDAFTIGADIGLNLVTAGKDGAGDAIEEADYMALGFGGFVSKGLGSGSVKAGLAFKTAPTIGGKAEGSGVFTIPVILEYAFF